MARPLDIADAGSEPAAETHRLLPRPVLAHCYLGMSISETSGLARAPFNCVLDQDVSFLCGIRDKSDALAVSVTVAKFQPW
jgi:hypothetical protein